MLQCNMAYRDVKQNGVGVPAFMKLADRFSFTNRTLISASIPLVGMFILILIILMQNYYKHEEMVKTSSLIKILPDVNELAHVMQIERGLSSGYLSSKEGRFKLSLQKQRKIVDKTIKSFTSKLKTIHIEKISIIAPSIKSFHKKIIYLENFRQNIDDKSISQTREMEFYTGIVKDILSITSKMTTFKLDKDISNSIVTLSSLSYYKETLGLKRAYGATIIEKGISSTEEYIKFLQLLGAQKAYIDDFNKLATKEYKNRLRTIINSQIAKKTQLYELDIQNQDYEKLNSIIWFNSMTELIDTVKKFEDKILHEIDIKIQKDMDIAVYQLYLWLLFTSVFFLVNLFIVYIFRESTKVEILNFTKAMKHLAQGDKSLKLPSRTQDDILTQLYQAYEIARQKLLEGDKYMQLYLEQKDKELKKQQQEKMQLEEIAFKDPLTGAINRRKFKKLSELEVERSIRYQNDLTFLMLDIDHFKSINDRYGHSVGDEVLKHFVSTFLGITRKLDIIARIGGEEFVIMLPQTNSDGAFLFAEKFRKMIFNSEEFFEGHKIKYTVSIGIATFDTTKDNDIKSVLQRADKALYEAKETGRDKTVISKD